MQHAIPVRQDGAITLLDATDNLAERITIGFLAQYQRNTREAYEIDLRLWGRFLAQHDIDPLMVQRAHIELWIRGEEDRGLASSTIGRRLGTVRGWYRYAVDEGHLDLDPGRRIKPPKVHLRDDLPYLDRWDMARVVEAAMEFERIEALTLVLLLGFNGLRIFEALSLDVDNYTRSGGFQCVYFVRKGGKPASVPLTGDASPARCSATRRAGG
jgi:integrase/recombinase XerD